MDKASETLRDEIEERVKEFKKETQKLPAGQFKWSRMDVYVEDISFLLKELDESERRADQWELNYRRLKDEKES